MNVRKMLLDDYEKIYCLWISTPNMGLNNIDDSKDGISKFLNRNPSTCLVVEENESIVGVIMAGHDGRRGYIYHMLIAEAKQRQGIGKKLLDNALEALRKEDIHKVALVVFEKNSKGNSFWEKEGFISRGDLKYRNKALSEIERIDT